MKIQGLAVVICVALSPCLHAESFTTNIVDGIETNAGPQLTVGATGPFNFLLVTNSGKLTNGITVVGDAVGADNNVAVVTEANSVWHTTGSFVLGNTGALNQVSVLNGASLVSGVITVGAASSSNQLNVRDGFVTDGYPNAAGMTIGARSNANFNVVTLEGPTARGTNDRTFVGFGGASNSLVILNGAEFTVGGASAAPEFVVGASEFSHGNSVEISGAGSKLFATVPFRLGGSGSGNRLLVDGGRLVTSLAQVGVGCQANNNAALVRGAGALWTNAFLHLGSCGMSNSLTITDGAQVLSGRLTSTFERGGGNKIEVSGTGSVLRAATLLLGDRGTGDSLRITDGGRVATMSARVGSTFTDDSNNCALVSGSGSSWTTIGLDIGTGTHNVLRVDNGASVESGRVSLGGDYYAVQNSIHLVGPDTRLNTTNLGIGGFGRSNDLVVSAGAAVSSHDIRVGGLPGGGPGAGDLNLFSIVGSNSLVVVTNNLFIGFQARSNRLEVLDGGQIHSLGRGVVGENAGLRNSAIVSGAGSAWIMTNELVVGQRAWSSSLVISNGGFVRSQSGHLGTIGQSPGGGGGCLYLISSSRVHVTGPGSLWAIADSLVVGSNAIENSLLVTNGGRVSARDVTIGVTDGGRTSCGLGGGTNAVFLNEIEVAGGNLDLDMNALNTFEVRYGTLRLRSGAVNVGRLVMTNRWSRLELLGGSLVCSEAVIDNRLPLIIGDGLHNATFYGRYITAPRGIVVREHALLESRGPITANVTNFGTVSPFIFGTLVSTNFVQQPSGTLLIEVSFQATASLRASNAVLNGKLLIRRDLSDPPSNTVTIIRAFAVNGTFSNATNGARLKTTDNLGSFIVDYTPTSVTLRDYQSTDLDGDGIEDAWATQHLGHSPLTPAEKSADQDGDGASNYDEFVAGTDPENSTSVLRASISYANGAATLVFPHQEGKRYRIVWSPVLAEWASGRADWRFIMDPDFGFPEPGLCRWTEDGRWGGLGSPARIFRVMVEFE